MIKRHSFGISAITTLGYLELVVCSACGLVLGDAFDIRRAENADKGGTAAGQVAGYANNDASADDTGAGGSPVRPGADAAAEGRGTPAAGGAGVDASAGSSASTAAGGSAVGGSPDGGTGGRSTGGANVGGNGMGGANVGGNGMGGANVGGNGRGEANVGGNGTGGVSAGGSSALGGAAAGGAAAGGAAGRGGAGSVDSGSVPCPGTGGPTMVRLPAGYCIDSTEVTRAQYFAWLSSVPAPSPADQISSCSWNQSFEPDAGCMSDQYVYKGNNADKHPAVCVDWCDAYAYCLGVGKRLCGRIGGGAAGLGDYANAAVSQWYRACVSGPAGNTYPYGSTFMPNACNGLANGIITTVEAGSMLSCQSSVAGYEGVFDLSGNVYEWEDACDNSDPSSGCNIRGGGWYTGADYTSCNGWVGEARNSPDRLVGFRCCSDP